MVSLQIAVLPIEGVYRSISKPANELQIYWNRIYLNHLVDLNWDIFENTHLLRAKKKYLLFNHSKVFFLSVKKFTAQFHLLKYNNPFEIW